MVIPSFSVRLYYEFTVGRAAAFRWDRPRGRGTRCLQTWPIVFVSANFSPLKCPILFFTCLRTHSNILRTTCAIEVSEERLSYCFLVEGRTGTLGLTVLPWSHEVRSSAHFTLKCRKRKSEENADAHGEYLSMSDEEYSEAHSHENFKTVRNHRTRRARKNASSQSSANMSEATRMPELTVVFIPTHSAASVRRLIR